MDMKIGDEVEYREAFLHGTRENSRLIGSTRIVGETAKFWKTEGGMYFRKEGLQLFPRYLGYDRFITKPGVTPPKSP